MGLNANAVRGRYECRNRVKFEVRCRAICITTRQGGQDWWIDRLMRSPKVRGKKGR